MNNPIMYAATVLIWGSTWLAIKFQLGVVPPTQSVAYRFVLAALLLILWCRWRGQSLRFSRREHAWIALQGVLLFALNYLVFYYATANLTSGLISVLFSTIVFMNILNGRWFFGTPIDTRVLLGAAVGLAGIALVFWPELAGVDLSDAVLQGLALSVLGTLIASLGNMASVRNQRVGLPVLPSTALGMGYGALLMLAIVALQGQPLRFDWGAGYLLSLLFLSLFGSVIAFGCYLTLLGRIGADRAAYATVLFPLVALGLSSLFEGYAWPLQAVLGMGLVLLGNVLVLRRRWPAPRRVAAATD